MCPQTFTVFVPFSSVYPDNAMQVCFEVSLLGFLVSWMLSVVDGPLAWDQNVRRETKNEMPETQMIIFYLQDLAPCVVATSLLTFFSLSATVFLLLESICIAQKLVPRCVANCSVGSSSKVGLLVAVGFAGPLIYTVAAVPALYRELVPTMPKQ
jgi:hypothetical protein